MLECVFLEITLNSVIVSHIYKIITFNKKYKISHSRAFCQLPNLLNNPTIEAFHMLRQEGCDSPLLHSSTILHNYVLLSSVP